MKTQKSPIPASLTNGLKDSQRLKQNTLGGPADRAVVSLPLSRIVLDKTLQCRAAVNDAIVASYAERMQAGDKFPPLAVFEIGGAHFLADGWHRHEAAVKAGLAEFPVEIHQGTRTDLMRFAIQANATHGLRRTNRDKRCAVKIAVQVIPDDSDHAIAELCKVSHVFVGKIRRELETVTSSSSRTGWDGKKRKLPQNRGLGGAKTRETTNFQPSESGGQAKRGDAAQSNAGRQEPKPAARTGEASERFSFWDEWFLIEDALNAAVKKCPDERWRRELASRLCKFADLRCL